MTESTESAERLARPLIHLARLVGLATSYIGMSDDYHEIDDDVLKALLGALGVDAHDDDAIDDSVVRILRERHGRLVAPTVLHVVGKEDRVLLNTGIMQIPSATITLENGDEYQGALEPGAGDGSQAYEVDGKFVATASITIPADLPMGYHTLHVSVGDRTQDATLISAPERIPMLPAMEHDQLWGWMAQLYSIRSAGSWGVGDFEDLKTLMVDSHSKTGADFMLVNPLHACEPVAPLTPSPYLPISRRFINFTYIRPEAIEEYAGLGDELKSQIGELHAQAEPLNGDAQIIDRDSMWRVKMHALWLIFKAGRSEERQKAFDDYKSTSAEGLEAYATWCLCYDKWGAPTGEADSWEKRLDKNSDEVQGLRRQFPDTLDFYRWLEWIADGQLGAAQQAAKDAGMQIGLMADMAVGVHPSGSDVWWNPERFAKGATVGAPPDYFNQQGQDWSQPPLNPIELENTGYLTYRHMVQGMFAHAGAVRIDHILGLFRLWWIPSGHTPKDGAYVQYDSEIMLGILALEASRAHGVVVGEDLGVVPDHVSTSLSAHQVLGCAVEWFEQMDGKFRAPKDWREFSLASVNTHDLPPAAGYLAYEHVELRERLGLIEGSVEDFEQNARAEHKAMMVMLIVNGYLDPDLLKDEKAHEQEIVEALYRGLRGSPCKLLAASIVDGVGERRAQNQPGTNNEYPNWRIPLADGKGNVVPLEELFSNTRLLSLAKVMQGR